MDRSITVLLCFVSTPLKIKLGQPDHCMDSADVLQVEVLAMTDIVSPVVLMVWRHSRVVNLLNSGKSVCECGQQQRCAVLHQTVVT